MLVGKNVHKNTMRLKYTFTLCVCVLNITLTRRFLCWHAVHTTQVPSRIAIEFPANQNDNDVQPGRTKERQICTRQKKKKNSFYSNFL